MFGFGLTVAFIGIGVVFSALVFLILVIKILSMATGTGKNKASEAVKTVKSAEEPVARPAAADAAEDESEIMAVIAAAVAYLSKGSMAVRTISRIPGSAASAWSQAGRQETMSLRQI